MNNDQKTIDAIIAWSDKRKDVPAPFEIEGFCVSHRLKLADALEFFAKDPRLSETARRGYRTRAERSFEAITPKREKLFRALVKIDREEDSRTLDKIVNPKHQEWAKGELTDMDQKMRSSIIKEVLDEAPAPDPDAFEAPMEDAVSVLERKTRWASAWLQVEIEGHYEMVRYSTLKESLDAMEATLRTRTYYPDRPGIALAFRDYIADTTDEVLNHIINHHELPEGSGVVTFHGSVKNAQRMARHLLMTPKEWNSCFRTAEAPSGKLGKVNDQVYKADYDALSKTPEIYAPMEKYDLIDPGIVKEDQAKYVERADRRKQSQFK